MGNITQALRTAQSGLLVNQRALFSVANNISNVNTEGYSRKIINIQQRVVAGVGQGVEIAKITRRVDETLLKSIRIENGELNTATSQETFYARVQDLFGAPGDNTSLAHLTQEFVEAMELLAANPTNTLEQTELVRRAQDLTDRLQDMSGTIQELRLQADNEIEVVVTEMNTITQQIDQLKNDILTNSAVNRDVTDLKDLRDLNIDKLSKLVDISYYFRSDGDVVISTGAGKTLVETVTPTVSHVSASSISATLTHAEGDIAGIYVGDVRDANDITNTVRQGQLKGLISLRDNILTELQIQLDEMAVELRDTFNQIHNRGVPFPGRQAMAGTRTFIGPAVQAIQLDPTNSADDVTILLVDNNGDQSAVSTLNTIMTDAGFSSRGPHDDWDITDVAATIQAWFRANGATAATASINSTSKFAIALNSTTLNLAFRDETATANGSTAADAEIAFDANGDGVNDETVSGFANFFGLNDFFVDDLPDNIVESNVVESTLVSPALDQLLTFHDAGTIGGTALGTITVASGTTLSQLAAQIIDGVTNITASVVPDGAGVRLRISHKNGSSLTVTQRASDTLLSSLLGMHSADVRVASALDVREDIVSAASNLSTGQPQFNSKLGANGEYFTSTADDEVIRSLVSTFNTNNAFDKAGGLATLNVTFAQYATSILANNSSLADANARNAERQTLLTESLQFKSDALRGVNLDEELAALIVFAQAFAASARVISVVQQLIEDLERAVGA